MVKLAYQYNIEAVPLLLLRMSFALPVYLIIALVKGRNKKNNLTRKDYIWLLIFGLIGYYLASLFDFLGLQYIKASLERIILFIYPTLVILITWIFFKMRPSREQIIAIVISYVGIIIAFSQELIISEQDDAQLILGGGLILLSAITYASYLVGSGYLIPKVGAVLFTSYAMMMACVGVIIHFSLTGGDHHIMDYPIQVYWIGFAMAIISTVIPSYLISYAIKQIGASNFSIIGSLGPVSTIILAYLFLGERFTMIQMAGSLVVIVAVIFISRQNRKA